MDCLRNYRNRKFYEKIFILTSDETCHTALSIDAREPGLPAYLIARQYK